MAQAYLQQQIKYTVKLHLARDLQRGSLSAPTLENGEIRQIGKDAEYADIVEGKRYRIIERTFAVIPQKSGSFTIHGPLFEGEVIEDRQQSFGFFNRSKTISRVGPDQNITILPIPSDYAGTWLPSDYVELSEEWQPKDGKFTVGEPITRTLTLTAVGVIEEQLPEIDSQYPQGVKVYPDQANTTTVEKDNTLIAQRKETIAIIPTQAGKVQIPAVSVPWFNILTKQVEFAQLPQRTLDVSPSETQSSPAAGIAGNVPNGSSPNGSSPNGSSPNANPSQDIGSLSDSSMNIASQNNIQSGLASTQSGPSYWSVSSWFLLILWLFTLLAWAWQSRSKRVGGVKKTPASPDSEKQAWKNLELALTQNNQANITPALIHWLQIRFEMPQANLSALQTHINQPQLNTEINQLFAHRFGSSQEQWNTTALHQILKKIRANNHTTQANTNALEPLYPKSV